MQGAIGRINGLGDALRIQAKERLHRAVQLGERCFAKVSLLDLFQVPFKLP